MCKTEYLENIDTNHVIEDEIGGCKVRLLFALHPNMRVESVVLENLMLVFEKRIQVDVQK